MKRSILPLAALVVAGAAAAHVRLRDPGTGTELAWPDPSNIAVVIATAGSDDLPPRGHETALRNAIDAWNRAEAQTARLVEDASAASRARTDWQAQDLHLCFFDESDQTGYFPSGSATVAITPIWFFQTGEIIDGDVIFNGRDFHFTTRGEMGRFDLQSVATHELGHLLGLDHSGWVGSTLYPFVDPETLLHRSLSWDDQTGLRDVYPAGTHASITGEVRRLTDESVVAGAHVVALDLGGRTRAGGLTGSDGRFELEGLSGGTYRIYATPLDEPVSSLQLGPGWVVQTDFQSTSYGVVAIPEGAPFDIGAVRVDPDADFGLGLATDRLPLRGTSGSTTSFQLGGRNLVSGSALSASDPSITVTPTLWSGGGVQFQLTVPPGAAPGHFDLVATHPSGARSFLVAGVEVTPRDPLVNSVTPPEGPPEGGTAIVVHGSGFRAGARVVMGGEIYVDGDPGGATVVDSTKIALTTRPSLPGSSDVVVIDPTGIEGRRNAGYRFKPIPAITSVFPAAGSAGGGTRVVVRGQHFAPGVTIWISGVAHTIGTGPGDSYAEHELVIGATKPGPADGPPVLEVRNPDGETATAPFDYVTTPDPLLATIDPPQVTKGGGETVTITGSGFRATTQVFFGADPATGSGGTSADLVQLVDASTLLVTTPAHPSGMASVMARDAASGQASILPAALHFQDDGGGGCHAVPLDRTRDPMEALGAALWMLLLIAAARSIGPRAVPARRS